MLIFPSLPIHYNIFLLANFLLYFLTSFFFVFAEEIIKCKDFQTTVLIKWIERKKYKNCRKSAVKVTK